MLWLHIFRNPSATPTYSAIFCPAFVAQSKAACGHLSMSILAFAAACARSSARYASGRSASAMLHHSTGAWTGAPPASSCLQAAIRCTGNSSGGRLQPAAANSLAATARDSNQHVEQLRLTSSVTAIACRRTSVEIWEHQNFDPFVGMRRRAPLC